jgi:hypothetical protein
MMERRGQDEGRAWKRAPHLQTSPISSGNTGSGFFHIMINLLAQIGQDLSSGTGTAIIAV